MSIARPAQSVRSCLVAGQQLVLVADDLFLIAQDPLFLISQNCGLICENLVELFLVRQQAFLIGDDRRLVDEQPIQLVLVGDNAFLVREDLRGSKRSRCTAGTTLYQSCAGGWTNACRGLKC